MPQTLGKENFKDKPRQPKRSKVTIEAKIFILKLGTTFNREQPHTTRHPVPIALFMFQSVNCVQGVKLSRETTNKILERNNHNGYQSEHKRRKFFRAKEPEELWQIE